MIKRYLLPKLIDHLDNPEISLIIGPRQSGKTTLMRLLREHLASQEKRSVFLNYDLERDKPFFKTQEDLLTKIKLEIGESGYVFLDEIQGKENAGLFLKGLSDMALQYKFVVSGSGSLELKEKIFESLAGRKRVFPLYPLCFFEFLDFKTRYAYEKKLTQYLRVEKAAGEKFLAEYLSFGGYPKVVLAQTQEEKEAAISDIYESYLSRDIASLLRLKKSECLIQLVRMLSSQIGQLLNYHELSSTLGLSEKTVKRYLWYLEQTFIGERVSPFTRRLRKEIVKSPIFYFADSGLANYATSNFFLHDFSTLGFRFQNMMHAEIKHALAAGSSTLHYWRTKDGAEVDFVIDRGRSAVPIEVKLQSLSQAKPPGGLVRFIKKYRPDTAYVVNLSYKETVAFGKTQIHFIPYYQLAGAPELSYESKSKPKKDQQDFEARISPNRHKIT